MKKLILTVLTMIVAVSISAGELGINAQNIKKASPDGYAIIKAIAIDKWGDDHQMILYEINEQCDKLVEVVTLLFEGGDLEIFVSAVIKWSIGGMDQHNIDILSTWINGGDTNIIFMLVVDWSMVSYEYKEQIGAAGAY